MKVKGDGSNWELGMTDEKTGGGADAYHSVYD
jgi:hypothetical protein